MWKCLLLSRISIVGGAFKQEEARKRRKKEKKVISYDVLSVSMLCMVQLCMVHFFFSTQNDLEIANTLVMRHVFWNRTL